MSACENNEDYLSVIYGNRAFKLTAKEKGLVHYVGVTGTSIRADTLVCSYDFNDSVEMVRHNHTFA